MGWDRLRVLVAFENEYRAYRETISRAIQTLRPDTEVATTDVRFLGPEIKRFDPHLVVSSPVVAQPPVRLAWIELPLCTYEPARILVNGRLSTVVNPGMEELLSILDKLEELTGFERNSSAPYRSA